MYGNKKMRGKTSLFLLQILGLSLFMLTLVIVRNNVTLARDAIRLLAIPSLRSLQVPVTAPAKATTPMYGNKKMRGKTSLFLLQILGLSLLNIVVSHCDRREWCDFFFFEVARKGAY